MSLVATENHGATLDLVNFGLDVFHSPAGHHCGWRVSCYGHRKQLWTLQKNRQRFEYVLNGTDEAETQKQVHSPRMIHLFCQRREA